MRKLINYRIVLKSVRVRMSVEKRRLNYRDVSIMRRKKKHQGEVKMLMVSDTIGMNGGNALINVTAWGEEEHEYAESTHESKAEGSVASGSILDPHCSKISTGKVVVPNWPIIS